LERRDWPINNRFSAVEIDGSVTRRFRGVPEWMAENQENSVIEETQGTREVRILDG